VSRFNASFITPNQKARQNIMAASQVIVLSNAEALSKYDSPIVKSLSYFIGAPIVYRRENKLRSSSLPMQNEKEETFIPLPLSGGATGGPGFRRALKDSRAAGRALRTIYDGSRSVLIAH
jgi:hypothetical protein